VGGAGMEGPRVADAQKKGGVWLGVWRILRTHHLIALAQDSFDRGKARSAIFLWIGNVNARPVTSSLPETGPSRPPLKLAELIEREFGGFVHPKMFDD